MSWARPDSWSRNHNCMSMSLNHAMFCSLSVNREYVIYSYSSSRRNNLCWSSKFEFSE